MGLNRVLAHLLFNAWACFLIRYSRGTLNNRIQNVFETDLIKQLPIINNKMTLSSVQSPSKKVTKKERLDKGQ